MEISELLNTASPFYQIVISALLGAFVGLHREFRAQQLKKDSFMGFRTMALLSVYGTLSTFFPTMPYLPIVFFGALVAFLLISYVYGTFHLKLVGITSEMAGIIMFWVGVLIGQEQQVLAIVLVVFVAGLNAFKNELHKFAGTINREEWTGALQLITLSGAMLPFLPREPIDPMGVFVPFNVWSLVMLISGIGFFGYFLTKYFGVKGGVPLTAFLGSIVSSTAVTTSLAAQSKSMKIHDIFAAGIMIATATMILRVAAEIIILGTPEVAAKIVPVAGIMFLTAAIISIYYFIDSQKKHKFTTRSLVHQHKIKLQSPFELLPAIKFGIFFLMVLFALAFGEQYLGDSGVYATAVLSGFVDVDAVVLSSLESLRLGEMTPDLVSNALMIALFVNILTKIFYVALLGPMKLVKQVSIGILITCFTGVLGFFIL